MRFRALLTRCSHLCASFRCTRKGIRSTASGQLDPLLEFDSEDCIVGRREPAAVSVRPPSTSRPPFDPKLRAVRRRKSRLAPPHDRRLIDPSGPSSWGLRLRCGGGRHRCADKPSADGFAEPGHASPPTPRRSFMRVPIEIPPVATPLAPVTPAREKKPVAPVTVKPAVARG